MRTSESQMAASRRHLLPRENAVSSGLSSTQWSSEPSVVHCELRLFLVALPVHRRRIVTTVHDAEGRRSTGG